MNACWSRPATAPAIAVDASCGADAASPDSEPPAGRSRRAGRPSARPAASAYPLFDALGFRLMSLLRVTLAVSGLLMTPQLQSLPATLLLLYAAHSAVMHVVVLYRADLLHARAWHWFDVAWGIAIIAASGGGDSLYYLFFTYPIMVGSLRSGTREGVAVTLAAVAGWLAVGMAEAGSIAALVQSEQVLLRAAVLLIVGYAIALWAGFEAMQRRRLVLLGELNRLPNPRFGPDPVMAATLEQLRMFYLADDCIAAIDGEAGPRLHRARRGVVDGIPDTPPDLAQRLLSLPARCTIVANARPRWLHRMGPQLRVDRVRGRALTAARTGGRELGRVFGGRSWVSVPLELRGRPVGRLCLLCRNRRFGVFDTGLLRQAMDKFMPLIETVKLLDGLATNAAETERSKICLDLHDGAIQPYLGLKLALEALQRKAEPGNALAGDIEELCRMTQESIGELRGYVRDLGGRSQQRAAALMDGLQRQIERFRGFYGMEIKMNLLSDLQLNDRLTAEVVQMVGEGLSNIGRHTRSRQVTINMSRDDERLVAQIINHGAQDHGERWRGFTPASLTRRAQQLGGSVEVAPQAGGGTAVLVTIPL